MRNVRAQHTRPPAQRAHSSQRVHGTDPQQSAPLFTLHYPHLVHHHVRHASTLSSRRVSIALSPCSILPLKFEQGEQKKWRGEKREGLGQPPSDGERAEGWRSDRGGRRGSRWWRWSGTLAGAVALLQAQCPRSPDARFLLMSDGGEAAISRGSCSVMAAPSGALRPL